MPRATKKTKVIKPRLKGEAFLKSEIRYFKGLSALLLVMLLVIFFTFSTLFAAMYNETRMMGRSIDRAFTQLVLQLNTVLDNGLSAEPMDEDAVAFDLEEGEEVAVPIEIIDNWQLFAKYGFKLSFPPEWTFLDQPYVDGGEVHVFTDGQVHTDLDGGTGDLYIGVTTEDKYKDAYNPVRVFYSGQVMQHYIIADNENESQEVYVISVADKFINLHFQSKKDGKENISNEVKENILKLFELE